MSLRHIGIAVSTVIAVAGLTRGRRVKTRTVATLPLEDLTDWQALDPGPKREDNPPRWALDPPVWDRAREAVEPYWHRYDDPWAVVTHVYKAMHGRIG